MGIRWNERPVEMALTPLPREALAGPLDVWIAPVAESAVLAHLGEHDEEQGGLLIGDAWAAPGGALAHIRILTAIAAVDGAGTAVSLVMPPSVWDAARQRLGPGQRIIGWYHSHPGLTAFFSDTDRRTQRAVFHHPWSVGWVIDPLAPGPRGREALFAGPASEPVPRRSMPRWTAD